MQKKGGIIGGGVLLDWYSWAQNHGIEVSPLETAVVTVAQLQAIVAENGITFLSARVISCSSARSFTHAYDRLTLAEQQHFLYRQPGGLGGLEANETTLH